MICTLLSSMLACAALLTAQASPAPSTAVLTPVPSANAVLPSSMETTSAAERALALARDWIVRPADNICGLRDANQLTHPARINFDACLAETAQMKRIREEGIDPRGAKGIQLRNEAVMHLTEISEAVRSQNGHCSFWKTIRHRDGRSVPDLSQQVISRL